MIGFQSCSSSSRHGSWLWWWLASFFRSHSSNNSQSSRISRGSVGDRAGIHGDSRGFRGIQGGGTAAIPSRQSYVRRPHDPCKLNETYERRKQQKVPMTLAMDGWSVQVRSVGWGKGTGVGGRGSIRRIVTVATCRSGCSRAQVQPAASLYIVRSFSCTSFSHSFHSIPMRCCQAPRKMAFRAVWSIFISEK